MDAYVVALESLGHVLRVVSYLLADRADFNLDGGEPERKCSRVMLDKDAKKALDRAEQRAMDHEWLVTSAILGHVFETEAGGKIEIELHSGELPGAANSVD